MHTIPEQLLSNKEEEIIHNYILCSLKKATPHLVVVTLTTITQIKNYKPININNYESKSRL